MIEYSRVRKVHFVGIGGAGMSGIAEVLHNMGFIISGSDIVKNDSVRRLKHIGIEVFSGHNKDNINGAETIVYSSAIKKDNAEVKEALLKKIPVISRAEMLAELMRLKFSIAVAGTHGKTTTTSMIAYALGSTKIDPTYVVGGKLKIEGTGAKLGKSDYFIAEADESDGSLLKLFPTLAIITNIEDDHLDYYKNMKNLRGALIEFANKVPFYGSIILNYQCENCRKILPYLNKRVLTYSLSFDTDVKAENITNSIFEIDFDLILKNKNCGRVKLNVGGIHNVLNALAAITVLIEIGIDIDVIKEGLWRFNLPERRFQTLFYNNDYLIIDDYAHHPTEITAIIETLKTGNFKRIISVFQPHRYTRLEILMDKFASSFKDADKLIITKLYAANQREIEKINSKVLFENVKKNGFLDVVYIEDFGDIIEYLKEEIRRGDAVVFFSAGDLTNVAHQFAKIMEDIEG